MKVIWKFPLQARDQDFIAIPKDAQILSVAEQHGSMVLYAIVDPRQETEPVEIRVTGTGFDPGFTPARYTFLGTVKLLDGNLMFHVFYRKGCKGGN